MNSLQVNPDTIASCLVPSYPEYRTEVKPQKENYMSKGNFFPLSRRCVVLTLVDKVTKAPHKEVAPIYRMIWTDNVHSEAYMATQLRKNAEASLGAEIAAQYTVEALIEDYANDPQNIVSKSEAVLMIEATKGAV
jgi:hypothetical protein